MERGLKMRLGLIGAVLLVAISTVGVSDVAKATYLYTLSSCGSYNCTTPTSTILSFTTDSIITAPPLAPPDVVFSPYVPVTGATAVAGSFSALYTLSYNLPGRVGSYFRIDGLVAADGSSAYVRDGFPVFFAASNGLSTDLPLVLGVGEYNGFGASPCLDATCYASVGVIIPSLLTVTETGAVPEPATWAMMIAGFGLIAGAMRQRQRVTRIGYA